MLRQDECDLIVIGTGSLARTTCYSIPVFTQDEIRVRIVSRSLIAANEAAMIANARAKLLNSKVKFSPHQINWKNQKNLKSNLLEPPARIVFLASSLQSPWELQHSSKWTDLVKKGGFGVTLPLQAYLALKVASLFKEYQFNGLFINGCYPDGVNPLLKSLDLNVDCGVGNVAILSALAEACLDKSTIHNLKIIAHHYHVNLNKNDYAKHPILAYSESAKIPEINHLSIVRNTIRGPELNQITGFSAAKILTAFLKKGSFQCHVPGPKGLPGGYPVKIGNFKVELDLPKSLSLESAVLKNKEWSLLDGALVESNQRVIFSEKAERALARYKFSYAKGFNTLQIYQVCKELIGLREILRN